MKRDIMYKTMLEHCSELDKLHITQQLCQDVLGAVVDGALPLTEASHSLVQDALRILPAKELKFKSQRGGAGDDDIDDELEQNPAAKANKARTVLISKIVKKNLVENIVPIIIALKEIFEKQHSPLLRHLMVYLREVLKDFKEEAADILAADPQLAKEIEFDLQKFEQKNQQRRTSMGLRTPHAMAMHLQPVTPQVSPLMVSPGLSAGGSGIKFSAPRLRGKTPRTPRTPRTTSRLRTSNAATPTRTPARATAKTTKASSPIGEENALLADSPVEWAQIAFSLPASDFPAGRDANKFIYCCFVIAPLGPPCQQWSYYQPSNAS
eukprot:m.251934 g.251934  ORF g.251934 m.251934 type:complete len:323 (+) comp19118_c0_seq5:3387-4355(+)